MADVDRVFEKLINDAVGACGSNMPCIVAHVEEQTGKLNPQQRRELELMLQHVAGFHETEKPFREN